MIRIAGLGIAAVALGGLLLSPAMAAGKPEPRQQAEVVVKAFNAAFARKDVEGIAAQVVDGGVKFDLKPAHAGQTASLAQEIRAHWYGVTPILFAATQSYTRSVEIIDSRAGPDMATVWTRTTAEMRMPKADKPTTNVYNEVYLLVRTPQGWKIGAMMDDRSTDRLDTTAPPK